MGTAILAGERLRAIVGPAGILPPAEWRIHAVAPAAVVAPGSSDEAAAVLRLASEEGWRVELAGSGSRTGWGTPPTAVDLVVSTRRLQAIEIYEPADLTITADAGIPLDGLAGRLTAERQWLALDAATPTASVGATAALATAGPLRLGYGTPRDQILGLRLVTGDGRILDLGGRVVKNVAGYDLVKLVTGSRGTLGLITRATLRLRAVPEADRTAALRSESRADVAEAAAAIRDTHLEPVALEIVRTRPATSGPYRWTLLVRFHGSADSVADAIDRVKTTRGLAELGADEAAATWRELRDAEAGAAIEIRLADLPTALSRTLDAADRVAESLREHEDATLVVAHAGDGIVRVHLPPPTSTPGRDAIANAVLAVRGELEAAGGTVVVARGAGLLGEGLDPWGRASSPVALMHSLREIFDPQGILSSGRFIA